MLPEDGTASGSGRWDGEFYLEVVDEVAFRVSYVIRAVCHNS